MSHLADVESSLNVLLDSPFVEDWWTEYGGDVNDLPDVLTVKIKLKHSL